MSMNVAKAMKAIDEPTLYTYKLHLRNNHYEVPCIHNAWSKVSDDNEIVEVCPLQNVIFCVHNYVIDA